MSSERPPVFGVGSPGHRSGWRAVLVYLVVLFAAGLPFGVVIGLLFGWVAGLAGGFVFGLVLSILVGTVALLAQRSGGGRWAPDQVGHLTFELRAEDVQASAMSALHELPARDVRVAQPGVVTARTGTTWRSWGEVVTVEVRAAGAGSEVTMRSRPRVRTTLIDYGKGRRNVEALVRNLTAVTPQP